MVPLWFLIFTGLLVIIDGQCVPRKENDPNCANGRCCVLNDGESASVCAAKAACFWNPHGIDFKSKYIKSVTYITDSSRCSEKQAVSGSVKPKISVSSKEKAASKNKQIIILHHY